MQCVPESHPRTGNPQWITQAAWKLYLQLALFWVTETFSLEEKLPCPHFVLF